MIELNKINYLQVSSMPYLQLNFNAWIVTDNLYELFKNTLNTPASLVLEQWTLFSTALAIVSSIAK